MKIAGFVGTLFVALVSGACFETPTANISFRCGPAGECPDSYECRDDGCCHLLGAPAGEVCEVADAAVAPDAGMLDAGMLDASVDASMTPDAAATPDAMSTDPVLVSVMPTTATVTMGESTDLTVELDRAAPIGGTAVALMSSDANIASVGASVTVPEGMMTAMFSVDGVMVGSATITASLDGTDVTSTVMVASSAAAVGDVIISEFLALTSGGGNAGEFVELANLSAVDLDIAGWMLTSDGTGNAVTAASLNGADPVHLPAGGRIYGVPNPADAMAIPVDAAFVYGPAGSAFELGDSGADLRLNDGVADIDVVDFSGWETNPASTPSANQFPGLADRSTQFTLSQAQGGAGNDIGSNWCVPAASTPGMNNAACDAATIDEALVNAYGADTDVEFIEVRMPSGAHLGGWRIRSTDAAGVPSGVDYTFAMGTRVPMDGRFVLADNRGGATAVVNADAEDALDLPDEHGGLQLITPASTLADALGYGVLSAAVDAVDGLPIVEGAPAVAALGSSLARDQASTDNGQNDTDIHVDPSPTPGNDNDAVVVSVIGVTPDNGLASSSRMVTVSGVDLVSDAQITVDGGAATCAVTSATSATCTFPDHGGMAQRVEVGVQNPDGNAAALMDAFTYTDVLADPGAPFFCNVQYPSDMTAVAGTTTESIYGQVYVSGATDVHDKPAGGIIGQLGYGADGTDPTASNGFTWVPSAPNPGYAFTDNNDEYAVALTVSTIAEYDYAYRFSLDGGVSFYYCDTDGSDNGYGVAQAGTLTVN